MNVKTAQKSARYRLKYSATKERY